MSFEDANDIEFCLNFIKESDCYRKILSENKKLLEGIENLFKKCSIFEKIDDIVRLQKVKQVYLMNKFGDLINETFDQHESYSLSIPDWKELIDLNKLGENSPQYNQEQILDSLSVNRINDKGVFENNQPPFSLGNLDNLIESEDEFIKCLSELKNQVIPQNNHYLTEDRNFENFRQKLIDKIDSDCQEVMNDLFSIFIHLLIVAKKLIELVPEIRQVGSSRLNFQINKVKSTSHNNNIETPFDKEKKTDYKKEEIEFSRALCVPEFDCNVISIRISNILKSKAHCELNESETIKCKGCESFFFGKKLENTWTCQFCLTKNKCISNVDLANMNLMDLKIKKIQHSNESIQKLNECKIFVLCLDTSGSMAGKRIDILKKACIEALEEILNKSSHNKVALVTFQSDNNCSFGDGHSMFPIEHRQGDLNDYHVISQVRNKASRLRTIKESFSDLKKEIENLRAVGGTKICSALVESVLIASAESNSEVIILTDGEAEDKDEKFYREITKFCKKSGFIKINVISFIDSCDLKSLGILASETNGRLEILSNFHEFNKVFSEIAHDFSKKKKSEKTNLIILAQKGITLENSNTNIYRLDDVDSNEEEILIKFGPNFLSEEIKNHNELDFQFKIETNSSIRVITKKIKNETNLNLKLIYAYSIRYLSNSVLKDLSIIENMKSYARETSNFMKSICCKSEMGENIISEIFNLKNNHELNNDKFYKMIYNLKKIKSDDIDTEVYTEVKKAPKIENKFLNHFNSNKQFKEFKNDIEKIFGDFNVDQYRIEHQINILKFLLSVTLIEKSLRIKNFVKKNFQSQIKSNKNAKLETIEDLIKIMKDQIDQLIIQNQSLFGKNCENGHFSNLIKNLNAFLKSFDKTSLEKSMQVLRLNLIDFSCNHSIYDFNYADLN